MAASSQRVKLAPWNDLLRDLAKCPNPAQKPQEGGELARCCAPADRVVANAGCGQREGEGDGGSGSSGFRALGGGLRSQLWSLKCGSSSLRVFCSTSKPLNRIIQRFLCLKQSAFPRELTIVDACRQGAQDAFCSTRVLYFGPRCFWWVSSGESRLTLSCQVRPNVVTYNSGWGLQGLAYAFLAALYGRSQEDCNAGVLGCLVGCLCRFRPQKRQVRPLRSKPGYGCVTLAVVRLRLQGVYARLGSFRLQELLRHCERPGTGRVAAGSADSGGSATASCTDIQRLMQAGLVHGFWWFQFHVSQSRIPSRRFLLWRLLTLNTTSSEERLSNLGCVSRMTSHKADWSLSCTCMNLHEPFSACRFIAFKLFKHQA